MTVHAPIQADFRYGVTERGEAGLSLAVICAIRSAKMRWLRVSTFARRRASLR